VTKILCLTFLTFDVNFTEIIMKARKLVGEYSIYEGWNFNSGNYLFTTDTK